MVPSAWENPGYFSGLRKWTCRFVAAVEEILVTFNVATFPQSLLRSNPSQKVVSLFDVAASSLGSLRTFQPTTAELERIAANSPKEGLDKHPSHERDVIKGNVFRLKHNPLLKYLSSSPVESSSDPS